MSQTPIPKIPTTAPGAPVKEPDNETITRELFPESPSKTNPDLNYNDKSYQVKPKDVYQFNPKKGGKLKKSRKLRKSHRKKSFRRTSRK